MSELRIALAKAEQQLALAAEQLAQAVHENVQLQLVNEALSDQLNAELQVRNHAPWYAEEVQ